MTAPEAADVAAVGDGAGASGPFSKQTLTIVIAVAAASLVVAAVLTIFGDELGGRSSAGVDSYSSSAIGHRALVKLLEKLDIPVVISRSDSAAKAAHGLLVIAEPTTGDEASRAQLERLADAAPRTLVVLPKWFGSAARGKQWIEDAYLLPVDEVQHTVGVLGLDHHATVERASLGGRVTADDGLDVAPVSFWLPQLIASEDLQPMFASDHRMLVGHLERTNGRHLVVLSDPDPLSNAGLRKPENARFAVALIERLREDGPVVIDETLHGYAAQPSLTRTLFRFPLVLATLQVMMCGLLVVWAAMVRFGPRRAAPPPIAPGKDFLIRNTAALVHYGGHHGHALKRYLQLTVAAVRHAVHAPALAPDAMTAWLERVRAARGGTISLVALERDVETATTPARVVELADLVFRWRMEMTHGTDGRT